jgi:hypothetical protein
VDGLAEFERDLNGARTGDGRERAASQSLPRSRVKKAPAREAAGEPVREDAQATASTTARLRGSRLGRNKSMKAEFYHKLQRRRRKDTLFLLLAMIFAVPAPGHAQQLTAWEYSQKEAVAYFDGMKELQVSGWGSLNEKVSKVTNQLIQHSGQVYRVIPGQTFQWGQAHAGGWIILDISSVSAIEPILAFRLAHEWGHEALGHQPNWYHPAGGAWKFRPSSTTAEDQADAYAGRFLAKFGYPLDVIVAELKDLPQTSNGDRHSDGSTRAMIVSESYKRQQSALAFESDAPLCKSVEMVLAGGRSLLKTAVFDNKALFGQFQCSADDDGKALTCRSDFSDDEDMTLSVHPGTY